jgi:hypothetical protein
MCLLNSIAEPWATIHGYFVANMRPRTVVSTRTAVPGMITTADAHTLTDGPTILAENVEKIGKFCISQANIPSRTTTS